MDHLPSEIPLFRGGCGRPKHISRKWSLMRLYFCHISIANMNSMVTSAPIPTTTQEETTTFRDAEIGTMVQLSYKGDPTRDNIFNSANDDLSNFFKRPIVADTYTWTPLQGAPFTGIFNPWADFFLNPRVANRLSNYALMSSNLHVRFLINGNGFYYGRLMADYAPLAGGDDVSSYSTIVPENAVQASQRMKVFIDPSMCCSSELHLPFVYYKDAISPVISEFQELGMVYIRELNPLKHANGATQPLTVTVMIWATEVKLALPTSNNIALMTPQAGEEGKADEYGATPVAAMATAAAKIADKFAVLPVIGPYAKATSMAAGGMAQMAKAFGLSRPADISPIAPMRPTYVSPLCAANASDAPQKLTADVKQEISIDPNIIGVGLDDELSIAGIAARESYLSTFTWTTEKVAGELLWNSRVRPILTRENGGTHYLPACAFATLPFKYWRGKMRYRFQIVSSGYHRGRLRIVWDPVYITSLESNVQITRIIDISEEKDITIEVDWGQTLHYLATNDGSLLNTGTYYGTVAIPTSSTSANGVLGVYVLNDLATPNSTVNNDIQVNVYISAVDLQVASPVVLQTYVNNYSLTPQAGEDSEADMSNAPGCGQVSSSYQVGVPSDSSNDMLVYFGERISSFRQLLKRYTRHSSFVIANSVATAPAVWTITLQDTPNYLGYNSSALHTSTVGGLKYNYVKPTIAQYLAPAFVAVKGSQRSKYVVSGNDPNAVMSMVVARGASTINTVPAAATTVPVTSQSNFARVARTALLSGMSGAAMSPVTKQPVVEVEFPYYKNLRFDEARRMDALGASGTNPQASGHSVELFLAPVSTPVVLDRYVAVGEDYTLNWFQGCPPLKGIVSPA